MGVVVKTVMQLCTFSLLASLWICTGHAAELENWILQEDFISIGKRRERMQDSLATANTIGKNEIESFVRGTIEELEIITPNLVIDSISGTPQGAAIAIRGIGSGDVEKSFDPAIGLFIDGVFIGNSSSRMLEVFDFDRVTVLRGPQGALHGRNTEGGTIHIERTRPTGKAGVQLQLQAASYDRQQLSGVFNAPLIKEKLAGKFTVNNIEHGGSYIDNCKLELDADPTVTDLSYKCRNRDENDRDYLSLTGSVLWTPTENMSLYYIYQNEVEDSYTKGLLNLSTPTDLLCLNSLNNANESEFCASDIAISVPQTLRIDIVDQNFPNESSLDGNYHTLAFDWNPGSHKLSVLAAIRNQDERLHQDLDATSADFFSTIRVQDYRQSSWEVRFQSEPTDKLQTLVGSYYIKSDYSLQRENPFLLHSLEAAGIISGPIGDGQSQYQVTNQKKSSLSFFAHLSYVLNEKWTADIGVRHSREQVSTTHQPGGTKLGDVISLPAPISGKKQWNEISPRFGLQFKIDENAMLYALYAQGFRGGGFNERAVSVDSLHAYSPETVSNYELGLKTQWWNDRLRINVIGFQSKYKDKQETIFKIVDSGRQESVTENIARAGIDGIEVDIRVIPIERLQIRAAYGHLSSSFSRFRVPSRETSGAFDNIDGIDLLRAPENTVSVSARYYWNWAEGRILANASYNWISDYRTTRSNITVATFVTDEETGLDNYVPPVSEPIVIGNVNGRGIWNVSIAYLWQDWSVRVFSRNFNNKRYLQNSASISSDYVVSTGPNDAATPLFTNSQYNEPRYSGIEITFQPEF